VTDSTFTVFPAIDLRQGQVVRLKMGDPARQTTYASDPSAAARRWLDAGAAWLHVVNLDGAFGESDQMNLTALEGILREASQSGARVQFGGGLRSRETLQRAVDLGVERVILGTAVIEQPALLTWALQTWGPARVAVGLDAQDGIVKVRGWAEGSGVRAVDLAGSLSGLGLEWLIFTDIARDGLGRGLNLEQTREVARTSGLKVVASGGVNSQADLDGARQAGLAGAIVGRAIYEGLLDLDKLFIP
jgi:phosphoribosylformimino-5-aminoimidazole carboxamide ribotide isomerase